MLEDKINEIIEISKESNEYLSKIIFPYVHELDALRGEIDGMLLSDMSLELVGNYYLKLANMLYYVNASVKKLELEKKTALRRQQEIYNLAVLKIKEESILNATKPSEKKTQTDIAAEASEISKEYIIVSDIYDTALKSVSDRIKDGWNLVSALKYRYNSIVQEMQSESFAQNIRRIANNDVNKEEVI